MLTESFVVAALGAIAGVLMAFLGVDMLLARQKRCHRRRPIGLCLKSMPPLSCSRC